MITASVTIGANSAYSLSADYIQYIDVYKAVKDGAYGRSHAPAFQIASQAIDVIVFAADNVAVEIEGFPFEAAGVMTKPFDVG